jgi:hypothetical protein
MSLSTNKNKNIKSKKKIVKNEEKKTKHNLHHKTPLLKSKGTKKIKPQVTNHKTRRLYLNPSDGSLTGGSKQEKKQEEQEEEQEEQELKQELEQEGSGFVGNLITRFKLWKILRKILKIYEKIKSGTDKLEKFVSAYKVYEKNLKTLLEKRSEDLKILMIRYQQLIFAEKQQSYIIAMRRKNPVKSGQIDPYASQLDAIKYQHTKVDNIMKELDERQKATDKEIAKTRKYIEGKRTTHVDPKILKKFDASMNEYSQNGEKFEEVYIQLKKFDNFKEITDKSAIDKKELNKAKLYHVAFEKYEKKGDELKLIYEN